MEHLRKRYVRRALAPLVAVVAATAVSAAIAGADYGRAKDATVALEQTLAMAKVMTQRRPKVDSAGAYIPSQPGGGLQTFDTILRGAPGQTRAGCAINFMPNGDTKGLASSRPVVVNRGTTVVSC